MEPSLKTILLATDGSAGATEAGDAALDLARRSGAHLHLVHTWQINEVGGSMPSLGESYQYAFVTFEQIARELLTREADRLQSAGGTVAGQHLRRGRPVDEITAVAAAIDADLVVLGSRGLGTLRRLVLGSVADMVVHTATRPVLILRGGAAAWPPARVVIGDDGSPASDRAAALGAVIGGLCSATGTLVRSYPPLPDRFQLSDPVIGQALPDQRAAATATARQLRDEAIGGAERDLAVRAVLLGERFGTPPEVRVLTGAPAECLLAAAEESGDPALIAVGSRGLGAVQRLRLGSVSTTLLHAAHGPVLVVPPPQGDDAEA